MKIALIHHILGHKCFSENLKVVDEEFCVAPPIILAYVAAILERSGHEVILIDANVLRLSKEDVAQRLKKFRPDFIGFRADTYWFHRVREWASYLKATLGCRVILGGVNITLYPQESMSYACFDYGILGEANESLPQLLSFIEKGHDVNKIAGIAYRENGRLVLTSQRTEPMDFDTYPFPARHLLPNHLYYSFTSQRRNFTIMLTSTGCPYKCRFCAISKLAFRQRDPVRVVDEMEECYTQYGVREIDIFDAEFFVNHERVIRICDEIIRRGIRIEWSCRSRVDTVNQAVLKKAAQAGCRKIYYGIESVSPHVLKKINKGINKQQTIEALRVTRQCGIMSLGFFMVGNEGDTRETILATIKFSKELKLDYIQVCRAIAKPNTDLNDSLVARKGIDYWGEYIAGTRPEARLPNPWTSLSERELDMYVRKFYRDFYFRLSYILYRFCRAQSVSELLRYVKVGLKWLFANR